MSPFINSPPTVKTTSVCDFLPWLICFFAEEGISFELNQYLPWCLLPYEINFCCHCAIIEKFLLCKQKGSALKPGRTFLLKNAIYCFCCFLNVLSSPMYLFDTFINMQRVRTKHIFLWHSTVWEIYEKILVQIIKSQASKDSKLTVKSTVVLKRQLITTLSL